jgi:hypothetical protein
MPGSLTVFEAFSIDAFLKSLHTLGSDMHVDVDDEHSEHAFF